MTSKNQYIIGAVMVIILLCALEEVIPTVIYYRPYIPFSFSNHLDLIIGIVLSLYAFGAIILGVWWILKPSVKSEEWNNRFTLSARIPGYFLFTLMPMLAGLILIVLTHETALGAGLAFLSFPSVLIYLALIMWKSRKP